MSTETVQQPRSAPSIWWIPALFGLVALGVGLFLVFSPHETLSTFTVIIGIFLLIDGVLAIFGAIFGGGEGRGLLAMIGVLSAIAGLVLDQAAVRDARRLRDHRRHLVRRRRRGALRRRVRRSAKGAARTSSSHSLTSLSV